MMIAHRYGDVLLGWGKLEGLMMFLFELSNSFSDNIISDGGLMSLLIIFFSPKILLWEIFLVLLDVGIRFFPLFACLQF